MAQNQSAMQSKTLNQAAVSAPSHSTSLYVGDLDDNVSEAQLYDMFSTVAPVASLKVCRDLVSKRSLGYAYVNYNTSEEASRALELLNFTFLHGKPLRIMLSHRDPSFRKSGTANIFVKNLDKSIDSKALNDTFNVVGNILSCKVAVDSLGQSKGYGYVQFEHEESAQRAINEVNGMLLNNKQVFVGPFVRQQERDSTASTPKFNNVYVKNLTETTTEDDLHKAFGPFGPITSAVLIRDADGTSKCFGFINFEQADDAAMAVEALNGKKVDDKEWFVGRAQKKYEREAELKAKYEQDGKEKSHKSENRKANLYIKNLDDIIDDEKLKELFEGFGTITSCKVMRDLQGQSRGSGFVAFSSPDTASQVVAEMNGMMVGNKPLYVALAQRKEERQAMLRAQFSQIHASAGENFAPSYTIPPYDSGPSHENFYCQPSHAIAPSQQVRAGVRARGGQVPNNIVHVVQNPNECVQRIGGIQRGAIPQLQLQQQRSGHHMFRYSPNARNAPGSILSQANIGSILPASVEVGSNFPHQTLPTNVLASALASASPEQQRTILGDKLYPLVNKLEHERAGKITGMLLEMDKTEVLHLIASPAALKAKVAEAMEILSLAHSPLRAAPTDQLSSLNLNESLPS